MHTRKGGRQANAAHLCACNLWNRAGERHVQAGCQVGEAGRCGHLRLAQQSSPTLACTKAVRRTATCSSASQVC